MSDNAFNKNKDVSSGLDFCVPFADMLRKYREAHHYKGNVLVLFPAHYWDKLVCSTVFFENDTGAIPQAFGFMAGFRAAVGISDDVYMQIQIIQADDEWQVRDD